MPQFPLKVRVKQPLHGTCSEIQPERNQVILYRGHYDLGYFSTCQGFLALLRA